MCNIEVILSDFAKIALKYESCFFQGQKLWEEDINIFPRKTRITITECVIIYLALFRFGKYTEINNDLFGC